jgi:hypothetical protein
LFVRIVKKRIFIEREEKQMTGENENKHFTQQITVDEEIDEIKRELATRRRVYPNWIETGKIERRTADYRMLVLEKVLIRLNDAARAESVQPKMF